MISPISITSIGALIVAGIASYTDVRTGKILNALTFPAALVGIVVRGIEFAIRSPDKALDAGLAGAWEGVLGCIVGVVAMSVMKIFLKQMGHGDSKLVGAIGAFVGPVNILLVLFWYCMSYGIYVFRLLAVFPWMKVMPAIAVKDWKMITEDERFKASRRQVHAVAPLITLGLLLATVFQQQTLLFFSEHK